MAIIQSGASATQWTIDAVSDAGRVTFYDTNGNPMSNVSSLNNILNSLNDNVTITLGGQSTGGFNVASTSGTLTLSFEATINDVDWFAVNATPVPSGSPITSTTTNGQWVVDLAGFYAVRARISSFSSGSMTVSAVVTPQNSKSIAQVVAIAGTVPVSGSVNQGIPNTTANSWPVEMTDGTNVLGTNAHPVRNDPTGTTTQPVSILGTVPVSGTVVSNQGTANTLANAWPHQLTDGSNGPVAVKAASTPPVATDPSLVVTISPNSPPAVTNTGVISTVNSSTATLGSGATFTGIGESTLSYESVTISVMAIGAAAPPGTLIVEQSSDGINWDIQYPFSVTGGTTSPIGEFDITIQLVASNFRIIYTNGAIVQTSFRLQTIKWPIKTATPNATQKAIQPLLFTATQDAKDSGRVVKSFVATGAATVTSEAMVTLTPSSDFVVGATSTSFTVISGKRLRLQSVSVVYKTTAATALGGLFRLRISSSGAVTIATPMAVTLGTPNTIAAIGAISNDFVNFPDGLELSGTMQFGISQLSTVTTSVVDITITGYEY